MAQILETVDFEVPVSVAYNQWTQFESFPEFLGMVDEVTQTDDITNHWTVTIAGNQREFDTVIAEQIPDDRIAWTTVEGNVAHAGVVTFHKLSETSSRAAVQIDWKPEGLLEDAGAALDIPDRAVKAALASFKKYVEEHGDADGAWRGSVPN